MPTIVRENHDNMNATITLSIPVSDYQPAFKAKLNEYKKTAHMKGFRKGKTPFSVIRKMYGKGTLVDIINKTVGEELDKYIRAEELDLLGNPIPSKDQENYDFDTRDLEDFEFKFDIGIAPEFEVSGLDGSTFDYNDAIIPDSMVDEDIENARKQLGEQGAVEDEIQAEDVIKIQADELLEGGEGIKENGFANEFSVSFDLLTDEGKAAFTGKKTGDLVQFDIFNLEKDRDETFVRRYFLDVNEDAEENPEIGNMFQGLITEVTRLQLAELDQAFFDKYMGEGKVSSEEELRTEMKARTKMYYDRQADVLLFKDIREHLEAENKLTYPEEFLKRWIVASGNLPKGRTVDEEIDNLTEGLGWTLIRGKLVKRFNIEVEEAEIKQRLRTQLISMFGGQDLGAILDEYVDKMYQEEQQYHNAYTQVVTDKVFNSMKEVVTLNKKEITTEELEKLIEAERAKNQPPAPAPVAEVEAETTEEGIEEAEIIED